MMTVRTLTDRVIEAPNAQAIVTHLRQTSRSPTETDAEFMADFARRARTLRPSARIRVWSPERFLRDAADEGFLALG